MNKKTIGVLAAAAVLTVAVVPLADAAGYGKGTFKGKADSMFDSDRPATPIEIKVKGKRIRVVKAVFVFDCAEDGSVQRKTISTPFTKVRKGPAGGGASQNARVTAKEGGTVDVSFNYGLRERAVQGIGDATIDVDGLPCMDDVDFKANKR